MTEYVNGSASILFEAAFEHLTKTSKKAGEGLDKGKYKFFTSSSIQSKYSDSYDFEGPHLIFGTGGMPSIHYCNEKFSTSTDCFVMKPKDNRLLPKYIYYFFKGNPEILGRGFRGSGLKHLSINYLNSVKLPKPPIETQKKIVLKLEKAEKLIKLREEADKLTDEFLKAVFYELFGNYLRNRNVFKNIKDFVSADKNAIKAGPFGSSLKKSMYVEKGYKIYGQEQVIRDDLDFGYYYISREKYQELENYKIREDDILISLLLTIYFVTFFHIHTFLQ